MRRHKEDGGTKRRDPNEETSEDEGSKLQWTRHIQRMHEERWTKRAGKQEKRKTKRWRESGKRSQKGRGEQLRVGQDGRL